ncbi:DUF1801 domain-containing protein [Mucilaginibacter conchicola]|uniref:DUF1801 domain-containing protein n=1 Tax=Mucilaginibacter conchicola TaxID=2303333 RepID=A0A372NRL9_9SPHI|nr:DUF1801 domain-containing protein [Mucilaginibacter conchicola]RFZ91005.1 DUF1801 domain-containing protein [Mucilaginibacter conchicola]
MAKNKTTETEASVADFLNAITDSERREDAFRLSAIIQQASGFEPKMWGPAIVGFGSYHYKYESGREGDAPRTGFSPRVKEFALYLSANFEGREALLQRFGKHKSAKACIYVKKLADIDEAILSEMVKRSVAHITEIYG